MKLTSDDQKKLCGLLEELAGAVEDLVLTGLTTASEATRRKLDVAFREASHMRLLRLSSSLRVANEELARYTTGSDNFSAKRLSFFLNRAWLLSHGMLRALINDDDAELRRLVWSPEGKPLDELHVVTVGVSKKVAAGTFCAFEFRLRATRDAGPVSAGDALLWSAVFPLKPGSEIPPEGYLHLPQKQKFVAHVFLEGSELRIAKAGIADSSTGRRINLGEQSKVEALEPFSDWTRFSDWRLDSALQRLETHQAGPLDLEIEMQEELVLHDWRIDAEPVQRDEQRVYSVQAGPLSFEAPVARGVEGATLIKALDKLQKRKQLPPLFGLMHYERCRLILQPLSLFRQDSMEHMMISNQTVDRAALLRTLRF